MRQRLRGQEAGNRCPLNSNSSGSRAGADSDRLRDALIPVRVLEDRHPASRLARAARRLLLRRNCLAHGLRHGPRRGAALLVLTHGDPPSLTFARDPTRRVAALAPSSTPRHDASPFRDCLSRHLVTLRSLSASQPTGTASSFAALRSGGVAKPRNGRKLLTALPAGRSPRESRARSCNPTRAPPDASDSWLNVLEFW